MDDVYELSMLSGSWINSADMKMIEWCHIDYNGALQNVSYTQWFINIWLDIQLVIENDIYIHVYTYIYIGWSQITITFLAAMWRNYI